MTVPERGRLMKPGCDDGRIVGVPNASSGGVFAITALGRWVIDVCRSLGGSIHADDRFSER